MSEQTQFIYLSVACFMVPASVLLWVRVLDRFLQGRPALEWSSRRPVPWRFVDLLVMGVLFLLIMVGTRQIANAILEVPLTFDDPQNMTAQQTVDLLTVFSMSELVFLGAAVGYLMLRTGAGMRDLGVSLSDVPYDLWLGCCWYVMLVVPMLSMHFVAQYILGDEEKHPFIEVILEDPDPRYLIPIFVAATVAAPLGEEFLFRVILQGWLERLRPFRTVVEHSCEVAQTGAQVANSAAAEPVDTGPELVSADLSANVNPLDPTSPTHELSRSSSIAPEGTRTRWRPILITGTLFGLAHIGQGPAPISLVLLGVGLGYVYQRTHRALPGIVVHFLINLTAVIQLGLYVAAQKSESLGP